MIAGIRKARDVLGVKCYIHLVWVNKSRADSVEDKLDPPDHPKLYLNRRPSLCATFQRIPDRPSKSELRRSKYLKGDADAT